MTPIAAPGSKLGITLEAHNAQQLAMSPGASGHFTSLLYQIALAAKLVDARVRQAGLADVLGYTGGVNVQGERVMKLDEIANEAFCKVLQRGGKVCAIGSEELDAPICLEGGGRYAVAMDPLDGSSNIDCNVSIGTIFSVLRCDEGQVPGEKTFLQAGSRQVAAGYAVYGPQTQLVLTFGSGVAMFTLDRETHSWILTDDQVRIPEDTREFAINMSNQRHWEAPVTRYVDELLAGATGPRGKDFNMRWIASMVADVHRILSRGGVFMYPRDAREPEKPGKLRLLYEANPMGFIVEQAGGAATDGHGRILNIAPDKLHQRVAVFLGSKNEVERVTGYHR